MNVNLADFWQYRYASNQATWDLGGVSSPLRAYFDQLHNKSARILIAGAGNAYEAVYLHSLGFDNVYVLDFVPSVLSDFAKNHPTFNFNHLICYDFFELHKLALEPFDLIIEQTFFCAIDPSRRTEYAQQMHRLLKENGKLVGVLFDCHFEQNPPFGGHKAEYETIFDPYFKIAIMQSCHNSVKPRMQRELFIKLIKKTAQPNF